jgi:hypothetical protein
MIYDALSDIEYEIFYLPDEILFGTQVEIFGMETFAQLVK